MKKDWMKKITVSVIAVCMTFSLAACGSKTATESQTQAKSDTSGKVLKVAMECAYAPFNWTQTDDANDAVPIKGTNEYVNGYDIEVAKMICDTLGYELEVYKSDWDALILGLNSGKYDALICGMNITESRKESVNFSTPYRTTTNVIITRKDSPYASAKTIDDLDGARAITQLSSSFEPLLDEIPNVTKIPNTVSVNEFAAQVSAGKADVGIIDDATANVMCMSNDNLTTVSFVGSEKDFKENGDESCQMGIAVPKDNTELLEAINQALEDNQFDETKQDEFMQKALDILPQSELNQD